MRKTAWTCFFLCIGMIILSPGLTLADETEHVRTGSIAGKVYQAYMGVVLEGARVQVIGTDLSTTTNAAGEYHLTEVPVTQTATLEFSAEGYESGVEENVSVSAGTVTVLDTELVKSIGGFAGTVVDTETWTGLSGASIKIQGTSIVAYSDKDGVFDIMDIPAGTISVEVEAPGYRLETQMVEVEPMVTRTVNFALESGAMVRGCVYDPVVVMLSKAEGVEGTIKVLPIAGATVRFYNGQRTYSADTDENGRYVVKKVEGDVEGGYRFEASLFSQASGSLETPVKVPPDRTVEVDIPVEPCQGFMRIYGLAWLEQSQPPDEHFDAVQDRLVGGMTISASQGNTIHTIVVPGDAPLVENNFVIYVPVSSEQTSVWYLIDAAYQDRSDRWAASRVVNLRHDEKNGAWHVVDPEGKLYLPLRIESSTR